MMKFSKQLGTEIETIKSDFAKQIQELKLAKETKSSIKNTPETKEIVSVNLTKKERILNKIKNLNN